jgi:acyl-CoA thioesterase FadM
LKLDSSSLFITAHGVVDVNEIDTNQHMNVSHYTKLVDQATNTFVNLEGSIKSALKKNQTYVAGRLLSIHKRELLLGDQWQMISGLYELSDNTFSLVHKLFHDKTLSSKFYLKCVVFDLESRTISSFEKANLLSVTIPFTKGIADPFGKSRNV